MKKFLMLALLLLLAVALVGCDEQQIYYNGELRPVSHVEEMIADQLEVDNFEHDIEVQIYLEDDD